MWRAFLMRRHASSGFADECRRASGCCGGVGCCVVGVSGGMDAMISLADGVVTGGGGGGGGGVDGLATNSPVEGSNS